MDTDHKTLQITLDPAGVTGHAQRVVSLASQVVATALRALENDDLSPPQMQGSQIGFQFADLGLSEVERRSAYESWILSKGFQDLQKGIRETLEEALFYLQMIELPSGQTTFGEIQKAIANFRKRAKRPNFTQLLDEVNERLKEPVAFEQEFLSLQKARNCLEHRAGIVGPQDVDPVTGEMTLSFPRLKLFYDRGEEEIEIMPGEVIDTHAPEFANADGDMVEIKMRRVFRKRTVKLGQKVAISSADFYEIAMACILFASNLASKLPTKPKL